jgi:signal transduction histidine kinase
MGGVVEQCLRTILGQVRLLRRIASEFSTFSGEARARPEPVDIDRLLSTVIDPYRSGIVERIAFDVDVAPTLPRAWADRTLLARAMTNLLENAIQAMPAGGRVRVSARSEADAVVLEIADTGVGMDAESLSRAFEPFFSTKTAGSGLGLANAKRNIELSGGSIAIASTPGVGTTVTVTLQRASLEPTGIG